AGLAEIAERENAPEHGFQTDLFPLFGKEIHLQKIDVGLALHVDQVGKRKEGPDLAETVTGLLAGGDDASVHPCALQSTARKNRWLLLPRTVTARPGVFRVGDPWV